MQVGRDIRREMKKSEEEGEREREVVVRVRLGC